MRHDDSCARRLVFAPAAWPKWMFLCHAGPTEVAGFGLSSAADPLYLDDVLVRRQRATAVTVAFEDAAVADVFDRMADAGLPPAQFARVWLHTHPGASVAPSRTDEVTFARAFGGCDWSIVAILGRTGRTDARLRFSAGPGGSLELPTAVDWPAWPAEAGDPGRPLSQLVAGWQQDYEKLVEQVVFALPDHMVFDDVSAEFPGTTRLRGDPPGSVPPLPHGRLP
jgi:proteasome lid subunit RPN8/RPN11